MYSGRARYLPVLLCCLPLTLFEFLVNIYIVNVVYYLQIVTSKDAFDELHL